VFRDLKMRRRAAWPDARYFTAAFSNTNMRDPSRVDDVLIIAKEAVCFCDMLVL
jgi:hypothetical protein